jgi:hypothetical protein
VISSSIYSLFKQLTDLEFGDEEADNAIYCRWRGDKAQSKIVRSPTLNVEQPAALEEVKESTTEKAGSERTRNATSLHQVLENTMIIGASIIRADSTKAFTKTPSIVGVVSSTMELGDRGGYFTSPRSPLSLQESLQANHSACDRIEKAFSASTNVVHLFVSLPTIAITQTLMPTSPHQAFLSA